LSIGTTLLLSDKANTTLAGTVWLPSPEVLLSLMFAPTPPWPTVQVEPVAGRKPTVSR